MLQHITYKGMLQTCKGKDIEGASKNVITLIQIDV
jgi:hypothetical protein